MPTFPDPSDHTSTPTDADANGQQWIAQQVATGIYRWQPYSAPVTGGGASTFAELTDDPFQTNKATIADGDKVAILDSAAADVPKHSLWSLVKSTLKTYFDTLYATASDLTSGLAGKLSTTGTAADVNPSGTSIAAALALKAPLISPSFTTPSLGAATATTITASVTGSGTALVGQSVDGYGVFGESDGSIGSVGVGAGSDLGKALQAISASGTAIFGLSASGTLLQLNNNSGTAVTINNAGNISTIGTITGTSFNGGTGAFTTLSASGVVTVSAGTAAAPAIRHPSASGTGIFFPFTSQVAVVIGGTQVATFANTQFIIPSNTGSLLLGATSNAGVAWLATGKLGICTSYLGGFGGDLKLTNLEAVGTLAVTGATTFGSFTVGTVPSVSTYVRGMIYVSDESGGATLAYSNGTNWKRIYDNANIS